MASLGNSWEFFPICEYNGYFAASVNINIPPIVSDGVVYTGSSHSAYNKPRIQKIHALDIVTGNEIRNWKFSEEVSSSHTSLTFADGVLFILFNYGRKVAALMVNNETPTWDWSPPDGGYIKSLLVNDGKVYLTTQVPAGLNYTPVIVYTLSCATGIETQPSVTLQGIGGSPPSFANGTVFVTTHNKWEGGVYVSVPGKVHAFGSMNWSNQITDNDYYPPVVSNGLVFVQDSGYFVGSKIIFALDANNGVKKWEFNCGENLRTPFSVAEELVCAGTDTKIFGINTICNGSSPSAWQYNVESGFYPNALIISYGQTYGLLSNGSSTKIIILRNIDGKEQSNIVLTNQNITFPIIASGKLIGIVRNSSGTTGIKALMP